MLREASIAFYYCQVFHRDVLTVTGRSHYKAAYIYILFHLELELELLLESKLEFKLPRVAKVELLAVVVEDATYYIRWCSLNSLIRLIINSTASSLRSL